MTSRAIFAAALGTPPSYLSGQPFYDYTLSNYLAAAMPDEPVTLTRITFKDDPKCAYCEIVCLGPICRNCGARRVSP